MQVGEGKKVCILSFESTPRKLSVCIQKVYKDILKNINNGYL